MSRDYDMFLEHDPDTTPQHRWTARQRLAAAVIVAAAVLFAAWIAWDAIG